MSKPSEETLEKVGHELKTNPPKQLARTAAKFGPARAQKQRIAILLSKARKMSSGSAPKMTGGSR